MSWKRKSTSITGSGAACTWDQILQRNIHLIWTMGCEDPTAPSVYSPRSWSHVILHTHREALALCGAVGWLRLQLVSSYFKADGSIQTALNFSALSFSFDRQIKQQDRGGQEHTDRKLCFTMEQGRPEHTDSDSHICFLTQGASLAQIYY